MQFVRVHKKEAIILVIVLIVILGISTIFGRYIYNIVNNYILETKGFYFNSTTLGTNTKKYKINNWDGVNSYTLTIDLNNRKNSLKNTESDIKYEISVECGTDVTCSLSKAEGIIYETAENDSYQVVVRPDRRFESGEEINVITKAKSTYPYEKEMSASYIFSVEENDFTYNIEDSVNSNIFTLNVINSLTFYQVEEPFLTYSIGDIVNLDQYSKLAAQNKEKVFSAIVTVEFDPNKVVLDMTNNSYLHMIPNSVSYVTINGHKYVSKFSFKVSATSSEAVIFYKNDRSKDYTYPIKNNSSIINVTARLAG